MKDWSKCKRFLVMTRETADTASLIRRIAENRFYLQCCAAIVNADDAGDPLLKELAHNLKKISAEQAVSFEKIRQALLPVAYALGLHQPVADPVQVDYYRVLGLPPTATLKEIKTVYRRKVRAYHPDTGSGENEQLARILEAYHVLSDETSRRRYDLGRNVAVDWRWKEDTGRIRLRRRRAGQWYRIGILFAGIVLLLAGIAIIADAINQHYTLTRGLQEPVRSPETPKPGATPVND